MFSDSDYGECKETRRSTSGCILTYNGDIIHWFSRRQKTVVTSSAEAEYMSLVEAIKDLLWCRNWLNEVFGTNYAGTALIREDNQAAIAIANNDRRASQRTKHIDVRHMFLSELVNNKTITFKHLETKKQVADILTKPLQGVVFKSICEQLIQMNE